MNSNFLDVIREDEGFIGEFLLYCDRTKKRMEELQQGQPGISYWVALPELSNAIFHRVIESVSDKVTPPHKSMFLSKLCESRGLFVSKRQRMGGRLTASVFSSRGAYSNFMQNRPPSKPGRLSERATYDRRLELIPQISEDGKLFMSAKLAGH